MNKLKAFFGCGRERERADRDNNRQQHAFARDDASWNQTSSTAPNSLPGPSSTQPQLPINNTLGAFPSTKMQVLREPSAPAQTPGQPSNAVTFPPPPQQQVVPNETSSLIIPSHKNWRIKPDAVAIFDKEVPGLDAAGNPLSAEEGALKQSLSSVYCQWCDRCKSGIPFYKASFICMECKYWLCHGCRNVHTTLHPQRVKVEMRQWINFSNEYAPASTCNQCSTKQLARLQCSSSNCSHSLCMACFHVTIYLDKFLKDHIGKEPTHLKFFVIYPDEWSVKETWRTNPCVCYGEKAVGSHPGWSMHCEKCHDPIEIGRIIFWCRDCRLTWGFGQWICEPCFREKDDDNTQHKQKHYFIKALIKEDPNLPDTHKERFYCPTCRQWLKESEYASHKHDTDSYSDVMSGRRDEDLHFVLSPRQKVWQRLKMYRTCDKELLEKNSTQCPDEMGSAGISKCMMCQLVLAYNQPATLCIKGNCNHCIYCASCTKANRIEHRHKDSTYTVKLIRKVNLPVSSSVQCAKCREHWLKPHFFGLFCNRCKYFAICWGCIAAASKGVSFEHAGGLPMTVNSNNPCSASDWLLTINLTSQPRLWCFSDPSCRFDFCLDVSEPVALGWKEEPQLTILS